MELTKNEKLMKYVGLMYAFAFIGAAIVFIFFPGLMFCVMNDASRALFPSLPLASDTGKFWVSLTVSMMAAITALSLLIYKDVRSNYRMAVPLMTAKFISALFGLGFFLAGFARPDTGWNTLANMVIFISDFPLGMLMLVLYCRVKKERVR